MNNNTRRNAKPSEKAFLTPEPALGSSYRNLDPPLIAAAAKGDLAMICRMLKDGVDPNTVSVDGFTALFFAAAFGYNAVASALLAAGANPDLPNLYAETPRTIARIKSNQEFLKMLANISG